MAKDRSKQLSKQTWKDPSRSLSRLAKVESKLVALFRNYRKRVLAELKPSDQPFTQMEQLTQKWPESFSIDHFYQRLEDLTTQELIGPANAILEKEIPDAFTHGTKYADLNLKAKMGIKLGAPLEERQRAWKKIGALVEGSKGEFKGVSDAVNQQIRRVISDGMVNEDSFKTVTKAIQDVTADVGENRARMIARTETMKAINTGAMERYAKIGIEKVEFLAAEDERTCFIKNTFIATDKGRIRIDRIKIGDRVLTTTGYQKVIGTMKKRYSGLLIEITTESGSFICTQDHPIFIIGKGWLPADLINVDDSLQTVENHPAKVLSVIDVPFTKPNNDPSVPVKERISLPIFFRILMPIFSINLKSNLMSNNGKIQRVPPDGTFLNEGDTQCRKGKTELLFEHVLSIILEMTRFGAEIMFGNSARNFPKFLPTGLARNDHGGASALFRAVRSSCGCAILPAIKKDFSTSLTCDISPRGQAALNRADRIPIRILGINREGLSTNRTYFSDLFRFFGFEIARPTTVKSSSLNLRGILHKLLFTDRANRGLSCVLGFMKAITRTIFNAVGMCLEDFTTSKTGFSNHSYHMSAFDKFTHLLLGTTMVYNLSVENTPEYYANGHLVHNCEVCGDLDGQIFEIDSAPAVPVHPFCRCTLIPYVDTGEGDEEEEATQKQPHTCTCGHDHNHEQITGGQGRFL